MLRWDTVFLMICMFLTGALCTLAWVLAFTRRVVNVVDMRRGGEASHHLTRSTGAPHEAPTSRGATAAPRAARPTLRNPSPARRDPSQARARTIYARGRYGKQLANTMPTVDGAARRPAPADLVPPADGLAPWRRSRPP